MKLFSRQNAPSNQQLNIEGMSCSACVAHVERALREVPGVTVAQMDLAQKRAVVSGTAGEKTLLEAVAGAGYEAKIATI